MNARLALEAVDALGAAAAQPALDVFDDHPRVAPRAVDRDGRDEEEQHGARAGAHGHPADAMNVDSIAFGPGYGSQAGSAWRTSGWAATFIKSEFPSGGP